MLVIAETKADDSFPVSQFVMPGFKKPYHLDVSANAGGLLVYVKDHLISRELKGLQMPHDIQVIPIELNWRKTKLLLLPSYRPPNCNEKYFLDNIEKLIDFHSRSIRNLLDFSDINMEITETNLQLFIDRQELDSLIKSPTCFKGRTGRCIDLMLTNQKHNFLKSQSFETGFSDFHHMIYTILKTTYAKIPPKVVRYRNYKKFSEPKFFGDVIADLAAIYPEIYDEF